ncbi:hypothetical protein [Mycoplasma capricolum]|uniref:hypothetical protein n=1 Tax=Mycoplasma capricolum TaxID=2095 RepID=UPI003DA6A0EE
MWNAAKPFSCCLKIACNLFFSSSVAGFLDFSFFWSEFVFSLFSLSDLEALFLQLITNKLDIAIKPSDDKIVNIFSFLFPFK